MHNVTNFINLLGENYYLDFIIEPYTEEVDYEKHYILIEYKNKYYYELQLDLIKIKQSDIINKVKEFYEKSLSDLYIEVSKLKKDEIEKYLNFHIQAIKLKLNTLKDDFYIYENKSRYFSIFIDQFETISIDRKRNKKDLSDYFDYGSEIYAVFRRIDPNSYLYNINETESIYEIEDHCKRQVCLSILPFKLFQIGQHFIFEIEKIKLMNKEEIKIETTNSSSQSKMKDTYFDKFCELIDDSNILGKSTAIGVMIDLQHCIKEIKSETLLELQENGVNRNDLLDFKINEVEKRSYPKNADVNYIKKWINEYQISLTDLFSNSIQDNPIYKMINTHYKEMEKFSQETDKAYYLQLDFYQYFCKYYADELIEYFKSKMTISEKNIIETENENQLSVNQAVILLDRLGLFSSSKLENLPNTKKAKLISQLIGKNDKNIKTAIEKLELKSSEIKPNHQRDIDKIERILNNLE
jgi:hypothetical protein